MLSVRGLTAGYPGGGKVLDGIELTMAPGEQVALLGRNGMGKTTLLRTLMGHLRVSAGEVSFEGQLITSWEPFAISSAGIAYVPQGREIFGDFTVEENLLVGLIGRKGFAPRVPESVYARFPILAERRRQKAGTLSGGEQQQLAIARAIVCRPRLLLLDEPSEGIQPSVVQFIAREVAAIAREHGMGVLLVEQNIDLVLALTARVLFIENGRIVGQAPTEALARDSSLLERHLLV